MGIQLKQEKDETYRQRRKLAALFRPLNLPLLVAPAGILAACAAAQFLPLLQLLQVRRERVLLLLNVLGPGGPVKERLASSMSFRLADDPVFGEAAAEAMSAIETASRHCDPVSLAAAMADPPPGACSWWRDVVRRVFRTARLGAVGCVIGGVVGGRR